MSSILTSSTSLSRGRVRDASMLEGACHCGAVRIRVPGPPAYGNRCHCSVCHRYGVMWGYFPPAEIDFVGHPDATTFYARVPPHLHFVRCRHCGCVTHWECAPGEPDDGRIGINLNLFDPAALTCVPVRDTEGPPE